MAVAVAVAVELTGLIVSLTFVRTNAITTAAAHQSVSYVAKQVAWAPLCPWFTVFSQ